MLYDVLLTLPLDYDFVWRDLTKSFSTTKAFYIVCRYGALVNAILYVLGTRPFPLTSDEMLLVKIFQSPFLQHITPNLGYE